MNRDKILICYFYSLGYGSPFPAYNPSMLGFYSNPAFLASVYQRYNPYLPTVIPKPTPVAPQQAFGMERLLAPTAVAAADTQTAAFLRQQQTSLDFFGGLRFPTQAHPHHHLAQPLGISTTNCPMSPEPKLNNEGLLKPVTVISRQS